MAQGQFELAVRNDATFLLDRNTIMPGNYLEQRFRFDRKAYTMITGSDEE
jgi:hypothetical protein